MTSPETLTILRNLHITDPVLYQELSQTTHIMIESTNKQDDMNSAAVEEPEFSPEAIDDASDVPIDAVKSFIASGSAAGFLVGDDGDLLRVAEVEDLAFGQDEDGQSTEGPTVTSVPGPDEDMITVTPTLGRGHRVKKVRLLFGGLDSWSIG